MHTNGSRRGVMPNKPTLLPWHRLINTSKVMSLAVGNNGEAWSAPVYYLFTESRFCFFSNPKALHIQMAKHGTSAASIYQDDPDVKKLEGIQMSGTIVESSLSAQSVLTAKKYSSHFNISVSVKDILAFFASKFHARLYYFEPDTVYYMDNSKGFGSREKIEL